MNILFILGDGFDRNLGMETSYKDFYKNAYQVQEGDNDLIKELKRAIEKDIESWATLEIELGKYTSNLKNRNEFDTIFDDIRVKLADYMALQENTFPYDASIKNQFFEDMRFPYKFLTEGDNQRFRTEYNFNDVSINVITFNYTRSLEKILDYNGENITIENPTGKSFYFTGIEHIHGYPVKGALMI